MSQWLRTLAILSEDPGSIPSIYMVAYRGANSHLWALPTPGTQYMQVKQPYTQK